MFYNNSREPANILANIVPTIDVGAWNTDPINLANITNNDLSSKAGTGYKVTTGSGTIGYFYFDVGAVKAFNLNGKIKVAANTGVISLQVQVSEDGTNYFGGGNLSGASPTLSNESAYVPLVIENAPGIIARYFRLRFYASAAMNAHIDIYEIIGALQKEY